MKQAVTFHLPVYKDQAVAANLGKKIEVGDTVTLIWTNDVGASSELGVVVTDVLNGARTIAWETTAMVAGAVGNEILGTRHVQRVHRKHVANCPPVDDWQVVLSESGGGAALASVTSLVVNGVTYPIGVTETGTPAGGITQAFVDSLVNKLNGMLAGNGYVSATNTATTITLRLNGTTHVPSTWTLVGLTAGAWSNP